MATTTPASVKHISNAEGHHLLTNWGAKFIPFDGYVATPWTHADVWVEQTSAGSTFPAEIDYLLIEGPSPQGFLAKIKSHEKLWYRPNLRAPGDSTDDSTLAPLPGRLSAAQLFLVPKVTVGYPFLERYAGPDGTAYRSSWGSDLVPFDVKALPAPLRSLKLWTEVAPAGRPASADLEGVVIDPYSSPQEVLVRVSGHENIWALPVPVSVMDDPEASASVAYRLRASASDRSISVNIVTGSIDSPAVADLNDTLRPAQCVAWIQFHTALGPQTEIGPYTIRGGWPRGIKEVKLADSLGDEGPAVVLTLTAQEARGTVSVEKADVNVRLIVRAGRDETVTTLCMDRWGHEVAETGWQASHRWEGQGAGEGDHTHRKLIITACFSGTSSGGDSNTSA